MSEHDVCAAEIARLEQQSEALRGAIGGFRWLANNLHHAGSDHFDQLYRACLADAQEAMGDDWEPIDIRRTSRE